MTKRRSVPWLLGAAFLLLCSLSGGAQPQKELEGLEERYKQLEQLQWKVLHSGADSSDRGKLRDTRDYFVAQGDLGARFLVEKVREWNEEEGRVIKGDDPVEATVEFEEYLKERQRTGLTKGTICLILADLFPGVSPNLQDDILRSLVSAFTPSERIFHSNPLDWALARIGPKAVPAWLELAAHKDERLRCHSFEVLDVIGNRFAGTPAPKLDCRATELSRGKTVQAWREWWDKYGSEVAFSEVPSFFDVNAEIEKGKK